MTRAGENQPTMSSSLANVGHHVLASRSLLRRRQARIGIAVAAGVTVLSVLLAPDANPATWDWLRILLIGILGGGALLMFTSAETLANGATERQPRLLIAAALVGLALLLNLTFTLGAALTYSVGLTLVALVATSPGTFRTTRTLSGTLIATIPLWVWCALEAWTWGLTLLIPLAFIGVVSAGHMRAALGLSPPGDSRLTPRAHRLACWLGILGSALIVLVIGLSSGASNGVVALGAAGAIALVGLEAGTPPSAQTSVAIADTALLWVALCWIVSL